MLHTGEKVVAVILLVCPCFHPVSVLTHARIHCPNVTVGARELEVAAISILAILNKVKVEAFMWVSDEQCAHTHVCMHLRLYMCTCVHVWMCAELSL